MKKNLAIIILLFQLLCISCLDKSSKAKKINQPVLNPYVTSFKSGVISGFDDLEINLAQEVVGIEVGASAQNVLTIVPKASGTMVWASNKKIVFHPDKRLKPGEVYNINLNVSKIYPNVDVAHAQFTYSVEVIKRDFEMYVSGVFTDEAEENQFQIKGYVDFSDVENEDDVNKILSAKEDGDDLQVVWESGGGDKRWRYLVSGIQRKQTESSVQLEFNGKPIGTDKQIKREIKIPALESFRVLNIRAVQADDQYLLLEFSDPIDVQQDFEGLVNINTTSKLRCVADNNLLKVYFENRISGEQEVIVYKEILSAQGKTLASNITEMVQFEAIKPDIRFVGKGAIVPPTGKGAIISFETVNLNAVDLYVIKIFEKNIPQFMQEANLDESNQYELKKTARLILKKKIDLVADHVLNYGKWNAFSFDLSEMVKAEPGALYRIELHMKKEYSTYPCSDNEDAVRDEYSYENSINDTPENWDNIHYWPPYRNYNWRDRDNPCTYSYYNEKDYFRNVLVSDIGILAKNDAAGAFRFYVNSIASAKAMEAAEVCLLDYQGIEICKATSSANGLVDLKPSRKPYLAVVSKGSEKGYLRLDVNSQLSFSNFDVGGQTVQKGLKGFIYSERGVYRPGDSIYVNFVLEDKLNLLPPNHPITFTLTNPNDQITKRLLSSSGVNGFYPFFVNTQSDDPTGNWTARVQVGDAEFTKRIRVETVKPNRLKINLDFGTDLIVSPKEIPSAKISVKWLHGAIAKNTKVLTEVSFTPGKTEFKGYLGYIFDDPSKNIESIPETIFEGTTNENGDASFIWNQKFINNAPGMLNARFFTRAFESGGDFSSNVKTVKYAQFDRYAGLKMASLPRQSHYYSTGKSYLFEIATVDYNGKPIDVTGVNVRLVKVSWRWWWSSSNDNLAHYMGSNSYQTYFTQKVNTVNGKASVDIKVGDRDWGRYLLQVSIPNGHSAGKTIYFDWPYGDRNDGPGGATQLVFSAEKEKYTVGEEVKLNIAGGDGARALVSIENGSGIVQDFWVDLNEAQNMVSFKATPEMAPNVFVNVLLIQPHASTLNDHPIRMYGAIPVLVENTETLLNPEISMDEVLRPEKPVTIKLKERNGKPMTYTIAVVDDGLLDLTNFKTPDAHAAFYAREALGVNTWDMYDYVTGAYGGQIEKIFAIGGDDALNENSKKEANRFKPVVKFIGPFTLEKGKTAVHTFTMPRYVGSVRTMVVAGNKGAYGKSEKTCTVRNPLMVVGTLPRVLGPGETVKLPVSVFAMEQQVKNVTIEIKTEGGLHVVGDSKKALTFAELGEQDVIFDLKVDETTGIAKAFIVAKSGNEMAKFDIELNVRQPNQPVTISKTVKLDAGETYDELFALPGIAGSNTLKAEISSLPPINLTKRMDELIQYPYGCIEQTVSAAFPQLFLNVLMDEKALQSETITKNVSAALLRLQKFQLPDGGFSYWPGSHSVSDWGTSYAAHFLVEAKNAGFTIPAGMQKAWIRYQKNAANNYTSVSTNGYNSYQMAQAYRLYTLALVGQPVYGAMNRLRASAKLSKQAAWRLALAYAHAGRPETALELLDVRDLDVEEYVDMGYSFGSSFRDRAMLLETLTTTKRTDEAALLLKQISEVLNSDKWLSTQETAWALTAVAKYYKGNKPKTQKHKYSLSVGKGNSATATLDKGIQTIKYDPKETSETIHFENAGDGVLFLTLVASGIPAVGSETEESKHLEMTVSYVDASNNTLNVAQLAQGMDFKAIVTIKYDGLNNRLDNIALRQIFPSGWEILNARLFTGEKNTGAVLPDYQDIRDDRVYTFFSLPKQKTAQFEIRLNAAYAGKFYLPQVSVEAMYSDNYYARNKGRWVEVVKQ